MCQHGNVSLMQINCVAIDDEPFAFNLPKNDIYRFPTMNLLATFEDAISGRRFLEQIQVDLLFLDISKPDLSSRDLLASLRAKPMTIFTTAYKKFDVLDYLLKPILFNRFNRTRIKAVRQYELRNYFKNRQQDRLVVRSGYKLLKVNLTDIDIVSVVDNFKNLSHPGCAGIDALAAKDIARETTG